MKQQILVNIGNTHTQIAFAVSGQIDRVCKISTDELRNLPANLRFTAEAVSEITIASVVPSLRTHLEEEWSGVKLVWLDYKIAAKIIDFSGVDPTTIGADRLANALAATCLERPAMIIDFGTCITTEIIDEKNKFIGGAIIPGRKLMRNALHHHTDQLPQVDLTKEIPPAIGTTTREAISAVDNAVIGAVCQLITASEAQLKKSLHVYATGGDAPFFIQGIERLAPAGDLFTLKGLLSLDQC